MILSDKSIKRYLESGLLGIDPIPDLANIGSSSVDLTLGEDLLVLGSGVVDLEPRKLRVAGTLMGTKFKIPPGDYYELEPGELVLASTRERLVFPGSIAGRLEGRSSLGRLGLMVHGTASHFDPGFQGHVTLELSNQGPYRIRLRTGVRICAMVFESVDLSVEVPYWMKPTAKYVNQDQLPLPFVPDQV